MERGHELLQIRYRPEAECALIFLHRFGGDSDYTWERFPTIVGTDQSVEAGTSAASDTTQAFCPAREEYGLRIRSCLSSRSGFGLSSAYRRWLATNAWP